jgi:hypothetical protein
MHATQTWLVPLCPPPGQGIGSREPLFLRAQTMSHGLAYKARRVKPGADSQVLIALVVAGTALCCGLAGWTWGPLRTPPPHAPRETGAQGPASLQDLLQTAATLIARYDIASMNLLCARDLPGADGLDCQQCLATLDQWAKRIKSETERHLCRYKATPADFGNSEAYFRMLMMSVVLYEDFSIRYNPERIAAPAAGTANDRFFADSRDIFLHGLCGTGRMGTCSSMPVLYVALGRRLGYPLKLATTKSHLFLRWESSTERFDLEATGKGMNRYDDEHFKQWPFPVTEAEIKSDGYLKSLTPVEELALFLSLRGHCLREAGRTQKAASAYREAARLVPTSRAYPLLLAETLGSPILIATNTSLQLPSLGSGHSQPVTAHSPQTQ